MRAVKVAWSPAVAWAGGSSERSMRCFLSHSPYGRALAHSDLISSSGIMRPCSKSMRKMRPGCKRPFSTTLAGFTGTTPVSEAMMHLPSSVIR